MLTYQWTSAIVGVGLGLTILYLIRRNHLHSRYALWWVPAALAILVLGAFPKLSDKVAPFFGVSYPPVLVLVVGLAVTVLKILIMDIERSRNEVKLQRLIQRVAILEDQLDRTLESRADASFPKQGSGRSEAGG